MNCTKPGCLASLTGGPEKVMRQLGERSGWKVTGKALCPKHASEVPVSGEGSKPGAHSPGPWRECGKDRNGCTCGIVWSIPRDMPVATMHYKSSEEGEGDTPLEEMQANARLIAEAPQFRADLDAARHSLSLADETTAKLVAELDATRASLAEMTMDRDLWRKAASPPPCTSTACPYHDRGPHCHPDPDPVEAMREARVLQEAKETIVSGTMDVVRKHVEAMRARCEGIAEACVKERTALLKILDADGTRDVRASIVYGKRSEAERIRNAIAALKDSKEAGR